MEFNRFFCDEVTLEVNRLRKTTGATLYLITDTPPLTDKNNFTFRTNILRPNTYKYWNYYLYPGSNFTISWRFTRTAAGTFYLIKGHNNFQQWLISPFATRAATALGSQSISCNINAPARLFSFQVQDEDEYYFVFRRGRGCPIASIITGVYRLQVNISVSRFLYSTSGLTTAPRCSTIDGQCSLNVPVYSNYSALIVTDIPNNPNWGENIDISLHCSSNRAWAYVVVVLVPSLIIIGVCITVAILLGCVCWRKRDSLRACCRRSHRGSQSPQTATEPSAPTTVQLQRIERNTAQQPADHKLAKSDATSSNEQHLTEVPPPSYKASLDYPQKADLPPPYSK